LYRYTVTRLYNIYTGSIPYTVYRIRIRYMVHGILYTLPVYKIACNYNDYTDVVLHDTVTLYHIMIHYFKWKLQHT